MMRVLFLARTGLAALLLVAAAWSTHAAETDPPKPADDEKPQPEEPAKPEEPDEPAELSPEQIAELLERLDSETPAERSQAAELLGKRQVIAAIPKLVKMLDDPDEDAQWKATLALVAIGEPALPRLVDSLSQDKERARWKAESALKLVAGRAVPALIKALDDERARVRQSAAFLLGEIRDARCLEGLATAMSDKDEHTRWKAATSLTKFGHDATPVVVKRLATRTIEARRCAAWVFQHTRDPAAVPALVRALKDPDDPVRWKAAIALQKIGAESADPLIAILRGKAADSEKSVALWILEGIKDITVQTALRDLKGRSTTGEEPARPRPKVLPKSIALLVTSEPAKATVFVDDKYAGVTPLGVKGLSPGHHFLKLTKRDHLPWTKLVELLDASEKRHAKLSLKPRGALGLTSEPSEADVYIDGEYEGKTPLEKKDLDANPYSIRIEKQGFEPWEAEIEIRAGRPARRHAKLKSKVAGWYLAKLKRDPNNVQCLTELGHYYLVCGELDPAAKAIGKAIEIMGKGADTSSYSSRLRQEIAKMWANAFQYGGDLTQRQVQRALHRAVHEVWRRNRDKALLLRYLQKLRKSVGVDFTGPPA